MYEQRNGTSIIVVVSRLDHGGVSDVRLFACLSRIYAPEEQRWHFKAQHLAECRACRRHIEFLNEWIDETS